MGKKSFLLLLSMLWFAANAQTLKKFIQYGDAEMEKGNFYIASKYYQQGADKYPNNLPVKYKLADASRLFSDYKNAAQYYEEVVAADDKKEYTLAPYWAGMMYKQQGEYNKAISFFKKYKLRNKTTDLFALRATHEIESCLWAKENLCKKTSDTLINIGDTVNTIYSEFNAIADSDGHLIFSSIRKLSEADTATPVSSFYTASGRPDTAFEKALSAQEMHLANGTFDKTFTRFFFTQCATNENGKFICQIYSTTRQQQRWLAPVLLDSKINTPDYTTTQPATGKDEAGNAVLFFVSDRPGGSGGLDIWCAKMREDGNFENPVNLGKTINTTENEITPFYDFETDSLFFSSDWHIGFGGYDIFKTKGSYQNFSAPKNLGCHFNSPANDMYYYNSNSANKIFVTSNRKGSQFLKAETCCNDIYYKPIVDSLPQRAKKDTTPIAQQIINPPLPDTLKTVAIPPVRSLEDTITKPIINSSFQNIKQLLPVTLYFHNDEPECCNMRDTTALNYSKTYEAYWQMKPEYEKNFDRQAVNQFFSSKVDDGYIKLILFSAQLLDLLQQGVAVEIEIQGYCSPLNFNEYNIHLGNRRVSSLKNYFYQYRDGIFNRFIRENKLQLTEKSFGEETADKNISDNREDKTNSVYNPQAAIERRVAIIAVTLK